MLSPSAELWYFGAAGSAFGIEAGAGPEENMKEPVLGAGTLAGTTGAGKGAGSGAWDVLEVETGGGSRDPSEGPQAADTGLGLKKSRSDEGSLCTTETASEQRPRRGCTNPTVQSPPSEVPHPDPQK